MCTAPQQEARDRKTGVILPAPFDRGEKEKAFDWAKAFDEFFERYPKSKFRPFARIPAGEAFFDLIKTEEEFQLLLSGLEIHRRSEGWQKDGGRFIVNPERFLRECRWQGLDAGNRPARREMCPRCNGERVTPPFGLCKKCTQEKHDEEFWKEHGGKPTDTGKATPSFPLHRGKETEADEKIAEFTRNFGRTE